MKIARSGLRCLCFLLATLTGCEKPPESPSPAPTTETVPATSPTTTASTQPTSSLINVANQMIVFPPARMRLERSGGKLVALVFSNDPKDALKDDYTGNSFYLRMELDITEAADLKDANWQYTAPSSADREDSPYGIYLGGRKIQLQPFSVRGRFHVTDDVTTVRFDGQFQVLEDTDAPKGPAQLIPVVADLPVTVDATGAQKD